MTDRPVLSLRAVVPVSLIIATVVLFAPAAQAVTRFREFPLTAGSGPIEIASGPDGNLWFTELDGNRIGRITTAGLITEFPVPDPPIAIAAGPDGNLWFVGNFDGVRPDDSGWGPHAVPRRRGRSTGDHDRARREPVVHR